MNDLEPGLKEVVRVYKTVKAVDNSRTSDDVLADGFTEMIPAGDQTTNNCWQLSGRVSQRGNGLKRRKKNENNQKI